MSLSRVVFVGNIKIGGCHPIALQSMTSTQTRNISDTVNQVIRLIDSGAQMVRITTPAMKDVEALQSIFTELRAQNYTTPIIADVHYLPEVAMAVAPFVDKVRINPGNFTDNKSVHNNDFSEEEYARSLQAMGEKAVPLIELCKKHNTAIRVGVNHGSLCDRIISKYGNTALGMVHSALEWIDICEKNQFYDVIFSLKSSNVNTMVEATTLLHQIMAERGTIFPLHLGVTEAANGMEGRVKSAIGIGSLLLKGIGDTIRVSLTEEPENEILFAKKMMNVMDRIDPSQYQVENQTLTIKSEATDPEEWWIEAALIAGFYHFSETPFKNVMIHNPHFSSSERTQLEETILQSCRIKLTKTEIIACPSCGRTQYNIQEVLQIVKERFSGYPNLKIGVMGCVVNGPGEMADADIGVIGSGKNKIAVYRDGVPVSTFLPIEEALKVMESHIIEILNNKNQV